MFKLANDKIKKMSWVDIGFVKLACIAFTLMIAKLWAGILYLEWYWYLVILVALAIKPIIKIWSK